MIIKSVPDIMMNTWCILCAFLFLENNRFTEAQLDSGSAERVSLVSPDEKNVMIVSYHDLKRCLATAFAELSAMQAHGVI